MSGDMRKVMSGDRGNASEVLHDDVRGSAW